LGILTTVLLALGGGAIAVGFLRRIEEINRTSRSIMDGNLSKLARCAAAATKWISWP
jgi:hypothetical protein